LALEVAAGFTVRDEEVVGICLAVVVLFFLLHRQASDTKDLFIHLVVTQRPGALSFPQRLALVDLQVEERKVGNVGRTRVRGLTPNNISIASL
jgi:hypothetical protein